jgi:hypothetical protein
VYLYDEDFMRHRPKFRIPVGCEVPTGWENNDLGLGETLFSDKEVLRWPFSGDFPAEFEVERLKSRGSPHIPEKKPRYQVSVPSVYGRGRAEECEGPLRLDQVPIGGRFLVLRIVARKQRCFDFKGVRHVILRVSHSVATLCGRDEYISGLRSQRDVYFPEGAHEPTCRACLNIGYEAWIPYIVLPYVHPRWQDKDRKKAKVKVKVHAKQPTAFERILQDDVLNPPPKPKPERPPPPEDDEFVDTREAKLASRRETAERFRQAKSSSR